MKKLILVLTLSLFTAPALAGEITLKSMKVQKNLEAGVPYNVELPYKYTGGTFKDVQGCFSWDREGPYCFPVNVGKKSMKLQLRTGNASTYKLSGFVKYHDGKVKKTNIVSSTIVVK